MKIWKKYLHISILKNITFCQNNVLIRLYFIINLKNSNKNLDISIILIGWNFVFFIVFLLRISINNWKNKITFSMKT